MHFVPYRREKNHKISDDGEFTKKCTKWLEDKFSAQKVLLTTSGTSALDMAMLLCDLHKGGGGCSLR